MPVASKYTVVLPVSSNRDPLSLIDDLGLFHAGNEPSGVGTCSRKNAGIIQGHIASRMGSIGNLLDKSALSCLPCAPQESDRSIR
ncbi:hypothetical protein DSTSK_28260 [Desulforhabdus sp. TSK]|nr:hypothetical protein DSTSK_28260 [Desulforhabdus sp. TSK]